MDFVTGNIGWIEVICGPMFSGKSEELIRRLRRAMIARKRVQVFKPVIDTRFSATEIVSHGDVRMKSEVVNSAGEILKKMDWRTQVIGVDEPNFMGAELIDVANQLADSGKQVIIAGLDTDYMGRPFTPIPELLALAESITKTLAICMRCGNPAKHTQRLVESPGSKIFRVDLLPFQQVALQTVGTSLTPQRSWNRKKPLGGRRINGEHL